MAKAPKAPDTNSIIAALKAVPSTSKAKLSFAQLRSLWINAGGAQALASTMAAVALSESQGNPLDPWKVGYYEGSKGGKTKTFATPQAAAAAAVKAAEQAGPQLWQSYSTGAYQANYHAVTPQEKATKATQDAQAKAANPGYVGATTDLSVIKSQAVASAKAAAHVTDPWVTVNTSNGKITGFGQATGANPPKNVLMIGGMPATKTDYELAWSNTYATIYSAYTGKTADAQEIAKILESGVSTYTLQQQLSKAPGFTQSPIYKANGAGIFDQAKQALGKAPPAEFVRQAIANNWDTATTEANLRALPGYKNGPEFQSNLAAANKVYENTFGAPPTKAQQPWLENAAMNGWSPDLIQQRLRADTAHAQQYPGFQQGVSTGLFQDETGYRSYQHQINTLYNQYHGAPATPGEIHSYIKQGLDPNAVAAHLGGAAYIKANGNDIQYTLGAFGGGPASQAQLTALGRENAPGGGIDSAMGQQVQAAYDKALTRLHGAFKGVLASPALSLNSGRITTSSPAPDVAA